MEVPPNTEALTRLLRSKDISTGEICDVVSQLGQLDLYFPNKENFILELIIDRWNDQRLVEYKKDYRIWELFNEMWMALGDEVILKRLLKKLRFLPHIVQTLEAVDSNYLIFTQTLKQTLSIINSLTTIEVSLDNANSVIGKALELVLKIHESEQDGSLRASFMDEIKTLVDVRNMSRVFAKSAASYCNQLLLPSLQYFTKFPNCEDSVTELLTDLLGLFVFSKSVDSVKLLDKFVQSKSGQVSLQNCSVLFSKCIIFLSKEHFKELEKIFSVIVRVYPELSSELLKELSYSKKTMSQDFLQDLFDNTMKAVQDDTSNSEFWELIYYILTLDIEIGIKNSDQLLDLISSGKVSCVEWSVKLWSELIRCHKSARELPHFLEKLESYCRENADSTFLINDDVFAHLLSDCVTSFSAMQLKDKLSGFLNVLENNSTDLLTAQLLIILLRGLSKLTYTTLADFRTTLRRVFSLKVDDQKVTWIARYLVMDVFDDMIPEEILESPEKQIAALNLSSKSPIELFYYLFKLREYKAFDMSGVIRPFMEKISGLPAEKRSIILKNAFNNWSTIINSLFPQKDLKCLIEMIFTRNNISILSDILSIDDIFEEQEIMHSIIWSISLSYEDPDILRCLLKIPIQCITKSIRIELINKISQKSTLCEIDTQVLVHLLRNPTFRSDIEKDWDSLQKCMVDKLKDLTYECPLFEAIWLNHSSQKKEKVSEEFIQQSSKFLCHKLLTGGFEPVYFKMAFLVLKLTAGNENQHLRDIYVQKAVQILMSGTLSHDHEVMSWVLRTLYYIFRERNVDVQESAQREELSRIIKETFHGVQREELSRIIKETFHGVQSTDHNLLVSMFLLYSTLYSSELEYLYAQYMVLRGAGVQAALLRPGVEAAIRSALRRDVSTFNRAFISTFESFENCSSDFAEALLELYQLQITFLDKDNAVAGKLFLKSLSSFYTYCPDFAACVDAISSILNCVGELLICKGWLFTQYLIEMLFPLCLQLNIASVKSDVDGDGDKIFVTTAKVISNILFTQRVTLSNRHHLIITLLCENMELLSAYKETKLTQESAKSLARLITNFCEPSNTLTKHTSGRGALSSKTGEMKSSLRKHVPVLLVRFINLSVTSPFDSRSRNELTNAVYAIFDLLSQDGLSVVNSALDNAGRQYLRGLYADYKKFGKWRAD